MTQQPAAPRGAGDAVAIRTLIRDRLALLDKGADHFALLGVPLDAPADKVRGAYFELARQLHPDRLTAVGITDEARDAQRLFAQINGAFAVLSNAKRRHDYVHALHSGSPDERARQEKLEGEAMKLFGAEEAFRKGEMALRRGQLEAAVGEFSKAIELNPEEGEHHALWAWATWCAAPDKVAVAGTARKALDKAIALSPKSAAPHLYLGRIARHAGRDAEAMEHLQRALQLQPGHTEAASELRVLESRRNQPGPDDKSDKGKGGLFGRFRRS
jgi:curved DNA-binding protein CbpA